MAKKKVEDVEEIVEDVVEEKKPKIGLITDTFGNGDLNLLRDKINEIINGL